MSERQKKENQELHQKQATRWTAGIFESAGTMRFHIGEIMTDPIIEYTKSDPSISDRLISLYGGQPYFRRLTRGTSSKWHLAGEEAIQLAKSLGSLAPSRASFITIATNWEAMSLAERKKAASDYNTKRETTTTSPMYSKLVRDPAFMAGVLDARGSLYIGEEDGKKYHTVEVSSTNITLLNALKTAYEGSVTITSDASGVKGSWKITYAKARMFYETFKDAPFARANLAEKFSSIEAQTLDD